MHREQRRADHLCIDVHLEFGDDKSTSDGGAIEGYGTLPMADSLFEYNSAQQNGGALVAHGASIFGSSFIGNTAQQALLRCCALCQKQHNHSSLATLTVAVSTLSTIGWRDVSV